MATREDNKLAVDTRLDSDSPVGTTWRVLAGPLLVAALLGCAACDRGRGESAATTAITAPGTAVQQRRTIRPERRNVSETIDLDGVIEKYPSTAVIAPVGGHFNPAGVGRTGGLVSVGANLGSVDPCSSGGLQSAPAAGTSNTKSGTVTATTCRTRPVPVLAEGLGVMSRLGAGDVAKGDVLGQIVRFDFRVRAAVPKAGDVPLLSTARDVRLRVGTDGPVVTGTVESVSYSGETSTSTLWVALPTDRGYVEGTGVRLAVLVRSATDALSLPRSAVTIEGDVVRYGILDSGGSVQVRTARLIAADSSFVAAEFPEGVDVVQFPLPSELGAQ